VDSQNLRPLVDIREVHGDSAIETSWTEQSRIEDVGAIGGGDDDNAGIGFETIHFDQDLV